MTTSLPSPTAPAASEVETTTCDVCGHAEAVHDAISRRFCKATMSQALSRNCICRV